MLRKRIVWCGKLPIQIIMIIILSHGHTVSRVCSLDLGRFCYVTACPSKRTILCAAVIQGGLTLSVLDSQSCGKLRSVTGANTTEEKLIQRHDRAFEELGNH